MKRLKNITAIAIVLTIGASYAIATDYSQYSTQELANIRAQMQDASPEERNAFMKEWRSRMQAQNNNQGWSYNCNCPNRGKWTRGNSGTPQGRYNTWNGNGHGRRHGAWHN